MAREHFTFPSFHQRDRDLTDSDLARMDLADELRGLILDSFMSTADTDTIVATREAISELRRGLEVHGTPGTASAESHFSDRSPFYGAMNPLSMPMKMSFDENFGEFGAVTGDAVFTEPYEGPPGHCHGGFIAAAFDEVLGMTQSLTGRPGMTGKLSVTYRSPTPLHTTIRFKGWVDRVDGRKIFTKGTAHNGETLCAEAEALFLSMPEELMHKLRKGRDLSSPPNG